MKDYEIHHTDDDNTPMIVWADTRSKATFENFRSWQEAFRGSFRDYLVGLIYCHRVKCSGKMIEEGNNASQY